jgi:DNA-directed RNA polymerase subunit E'/Rpb7
METSTRQPKKKRESKIQTVYSRCLITRKVSLPIVSIGKNLKETIEDNIKATFEGKCSVEGYIRPNSTKIVTHSSGIIQRGNIISFDVVFECDVCFPVEGMLVQCSAKNITKAGIRAESATEVPSPIVVFIAKDHNYNVQYFSEIKEGDKITIRVIGQRFELNDKYVSIIGELVKETDFTQQNRPKYAVTKPRLVIEDNE